MVARDDDNLQMRLYRSGLLQKTVKHFLRRGRGIGCIKHIARNQQYIGVLRLYLLAQPVQKMLMLRAAVKLLQSLAQMPVRSM